MIRKYNARGERLPKDTEGDDVFVYRWGFRVEKTSGYGLGVQFYWPMKLLTFHIWNRVIFYGWNYELRDKWCSNERGWCE